VATRQPLRAYTGRQGVAPMAIFRVSRRVHRACFTGEMAVQPARDTRVALVAGATRGAGRAIAMELARAGLFVYATGRSGLRMLQMGVHTQLITCRLADAYGVTDTDGSRPDC
jgi:hypothetical protein